MLKENNAVAALLVHVGADTSNLGYVGPIFEDNSFEYLPIPEYYTFSSLNKKYFELPAKKAHLKHGRMLSDYLLDEDRRERAHYDPKFNDPEGLYTYGESAEKEGRLLNLEKGGIIFFYCSLVPYSGSVYKLLRRASDKQARKEFLQYQKGNKNKYVIGFFTVSGISDVTVKLKAVSIKAKVKKGHELPEGDIKNNQHFLEAIGDKEFRVVQGDAAYSALLPKAVGLTEKWTGNTFKLNELGREILGRPTEAMRGIRNLSREGTFRVVEAIIQRNPTLKNKLIKQLE